MRELIAREGDKREFEDSGYHCLIVRNPEAGYLSGFVGIPRTHSLYGFEFGEVDDIRAHVGLEFSGPSPGTGQEQPERWYFGFECNHLGDLWLKDLMSLDPVSLGLKRSSSYKTMDYVEHEVRGLAQQLKVVEHRRVYH